MWLFGTKPWSLKSHRYLRYTHCMMLVLRDEPSLCQCRRHSRQGHEKMINALKVQFRNAMTWFFASALIAIIFVSASPAEAEQQAPDDLQNLFDAPAGGEIVDLAKTPLWLDVIRVVGLQIKDTSLE